MTPNFTLCMFTHGTSEDVTSTHALRRGQESRLRPEKIANAVAHCNAVSFPLVAVGTSRKLVFAQ